jgi:rhamnogalacturonyl hydrolase YesR
MKRNLFLILLLVFNGVFSAKATSISKKSIVKIAHSAADWQLANPDKNPVLDWVYGPFVNGLMAIGEMPGGKKYQNAAIQIGVQENWGVIDTDWKANDHCTPQAWLELYELKKKPEMIQPIRKELDKIMEIVAKQDNRLEFRPVNNKKWSWCDALFMAPPTFARMGKITGEQKYYDFLHQWWWKVSAFYYDTQEQLYFRDETFFKKTEPNGKKIFWSRGNGWVMGGLVRVLQYLPANDPYRPKYEQQLVEMCTKIKDIQDQNGLWHPGLLDPVAHKQVETSGSAFFVYAIAYAVNNGIVDRTVFTPVLEKSWTALCSYVKPDGRFTGIQPIGDSPVKYEENYTMPYGVGAFLLAASEMYKLSK